MKFAYSLKPKAKKVDLYNGVYSFVYPVAPNQYHPTTYNEYESIIFTWPGGVKDIESIKSKFIKEYLDMLGWDIDKQIASIMNGGEELEEFQRKRNEAKTLFKELLETLEKSNLL